MQKCALKFQFKGAEFAEEIVHSVNNGLHLIGIEGRSYFCTFPNQFSRYTHVACLQSRKDVSKCFLPLCSCQIFKKISKEVFRLRTDGGAEIKFMKLIFKTSFTSYTLQHNSFAKVVNFTILKPDCCVFKEADLRGKYWSYAMEYVDNIKNRLPHLTLTSTPLEKKVWKNIYSQPCKRIWKCYPHLQHFFSE